MTSAHEAAPPQVLRDRLRYLDAIIAATDRYAEVLASIVASEDRASAFVAVQEMLSIDRDTAKAVLDIRWENLTAQRRQETREDRDRARRELGEWTGDRP